MKINHSELITEIQSIQPLYSKGKKATYIPALKLQNDDDFAFVIKSIDGEQFEYGNVSHEITIQSVSKVLMLLFAMELYGMESILQKVSLEPTGQGFRSLPGFSEHDEELYLNPMMNIGALIVTSLIVKRFGTESFTMFKAYVSALINNEVLQMDDTVYKSESSTGHRNRAFAYLLMDMKLIDEPELVLETYYQQCSLLMTPVQLAKIGAYLSSSTHCNPIGYAEPDHVRSVLAMMFSSGMYNESGEMSVQIGIPIKSGVSGILLGAVPGKMGISIFSPPLNQSGNSLVGIELLRKLSNKWDLSIFT